MIPEKLEYQEYIIDRLVEKEKLILIVDMGMGKTYCTLAAINKLMFDSYDIKKVLVIAPLRVADMTWQEEIEKWQPLNHLKLSKILGSKSKRIAALESQADIYIINRENTKWLVDYQIAKGVWDFDCVVIDESSSFKNSRTNRFRALKKVIPLSQRVYELTGTPAPNGLMDLWSQVYLLDQGKRLGRTLGAFREKYFNPGRRNRTVIFDYILKEGAEQKIYKQIEDIAISLKAKDHIKMPERIDNYIKITMPEKIKLQYEELEREFVLEIDEDEITATSAAVIMNKLLQLANGAVYDEDRKVIHIHDLKLEELDSIIELNEGKPVLVLYNFIHDKDRIMKRYEHLKPRQLNNLQDKRDWDEGKVPMLIAHPMSVGHGLNLQAGGHIIIWFGMSWSLEGYMQTNARLIRPGQKETVIIHHLLCKGTEDETVIKRLNAKTISQDSLIEAVKTKIRTIKEKTQNKNA